MLTSIISASNYTNYISVNNQKYQIQLILINLHPNEYSQQLHYYPLAVKLEKCAGSCNTFNDLSSRVYILNKKEKLNNSCF